MTYNVESQLVYMLLLLYTAAEVRSEFLLSSVDVSRPTVHCKVLLLSSPKAWLVPQVWQTYK